MNFRLFAAVGLIALVGCQSQTNPPANAPTGVASTAGDGRVVISWNQEPGLTYWIFFQAGSFVAPASPESAVIINAMTPRVVVPLANGTQYAFVMNATENDSSAGPPSPVVTATPRLAGVTWVSGTALGMPPANLNALAFSGTRFVAVGESAAVFSGDFSYTNADPPGVGSWLPPTTPPPGVTANLTAVTYSSQFVALGADGSISTSGDGLTWASVPANAVPSAGMNGIAFGLGIHVAVGNNGTAFWSDNLETWTAGVVPNNTPDLLGVSFLNGGFVATGAGGTLLTSADGKTWIAQVSNTGNALRAAAFRPITGYVAVGDAGTIISSPDGTAWTPVPAVTAQSLRSVVHGSRLVAVGQGGAAAYSDDGTSWTLTSAGTANLSQLVFAPGMYLAVGAAGANVVSK